MNILTFDVEEWYLRKVRRGGDPNKYRDLYDCLGNLLDMLDERNIKATFFCVGGMATEFPDVVKQIEGRGHEIGCHSFKHDLLNKLSREEVMQDTRTAVDALEQCIGKKILSYRAPAFSVGKENKWVFEVLNECRITRDASVFPAERDFGGFPEFGDKSPAMVNLNKAVIKEFPICTTKIFGSEIAYSGGGYFRFFPLWFIKHEMAKTDYAMTYFHVRDLTPDMLGMATKEAYEEYFNEPGTLLARYKRYVKSNLGKKSAFKKLKELIASTDFISLEEADRLINWDQSSLVVL